MYFFLNFIEVIVREISTEELLDPNGPYVTKNIRVCWLQHNFIVMCNSKYYCSLLKPILQAKKLLLLLNCIIIAALTVSFQVKLKLLMN